MGITAGQRAAAQRVYLTAITGGNRERGCRDGSWRADRLPGIDGAGSPRDRL